jgi:hypothetical protein
MIYLRVAGLRRRVRLIQNLVGRGNLYLRWCRARLGYEHVRGRHNTRTPRVRHESDGDDASHVADGAFQWVWWRDREDDTVLMGVINQCSNG